jgi:hypothetical protein
VKFLLDENFPLPLYRRMKAAGYDVEHIIVLGQRGLPDAVIRLRLATEELVLLTNDREFEDLPVDYRGRVIISRVRQSLPIKDRVEICFAGIEKFAAADPPGKLFDLLETGEILPWQFHEEA